LCRTAAILLKPSRKVYPDEWGAANRTYPPTTGWPGPRNPQITGYLIPFGRAIHEGKYKRVVAVTAAQSGKTETFLDVMGARLDQRPAPILYVGPSQDFVTDQFEPRLMGLLDEAPTLAAKVARGKASKKTQKWIAGVKVRLGYAGSSTSLKSDSFSLGLVDEYDEMTANVKGQGDPLGLADARGETFADFVIAVTSTPSKGLVETEVDPVSGLEFWKVGDPQQIESPIWRLFQQGTRHHFAWACPHCAEHFIPMRKHLKWPKGASPSQALREAYVACPKCGGVIEDHHKPAMIAGGVQIAPGQTIEQARACENEPDVTTWSCWTSGLCSPFVTFGQRAQKMLDAMATGEPDKIQTVVNANFGELHSLVSAEDRPTWEAVKKRAQASPYKAGEIPAEAVNLVMGVDVQRMSLYWTVRAFGPRGTSWNVDHGQLFGPTEQDAVWDDLADLMLQPFGGMMVELVGVDSGFRPGKPEAVPEHKVYEFARKWPKWVVPTKGRDVQNPPYKVSQIEVKTDGKRRAYSIKLAWLSTDFFKSLFTARLSLPLGSMGAFYPHSETTEDYCKHLTSEARVIEGGKPKWVATSKDNHWLDTEAICEAMGYTLNVQRNPEMSRTERAEDERGEEQEAPPPEPKRTGLPRKPAPEPTNQPQDSLKSRFARFGQKANQKVR
jgi:phage terminase large subunit GpA-like protein